VLAELVEELVMWAAAWVAEQVWAPAGKEVLASGGLGLVKGTEE
jgi:hypothetical protein